MHRSTTPMFRGVFKAVPAVTAVTMLALACLIGNDARAQAGSTIDGKALGKALSRAISPKDVPFNGCTLKRNFLDDNWKDSATIQFACEVGTEHRDVQDYSVTVSINTSRPKSFYCSSAKVGKSVPLRLGQTSCGLTIEDTSKSVLSFISSFRHEYRIEVFDRYTGRDPGKPVKAGITVSVVNRTDGKSRYYHPGQNETWAYELAKRVQKRAAMTFAGLAEEGPQTARQSTGSTNVRPSESRPPRRAGPRQRAQNQSSGGPRLADLNGIDLARIIKRVVPPSRITFRGCRMVEDPPSQRASAGMSSYGTKFKCRDDTQQQGIRDYEVFVNLKLNHKAIGFCHKLPEPGGEGSAFGRFLQPNVNNSQKFYTGIGDKACGTTKRVLRQQMPRGSNHVYQFEIYDRLSAKKTIGVHVGVSSWTRGKPLNLTFDRKLARGIAEELYAALYREATGRSVTAAADNRPPANNQPPPQQDTGPKFAKLEIDNTTTADLTFRHYFEHPQGRLRTFTYKEGGRKVTVKKRVKEIRYPNSVVGANKKRSFGHSLRKGFNHIEYQPEIVATYFINDRRVRDDTGDAFFDAHARGIVNGEKFLKRKAFRLIVRDTGKIFTATIEPRHIEPALPKGVLPGSLYIENNLDVPVRVYFDKNQDKALKGQGTVGGLAQLMMLDTRRPDYGGKRVEIPARSTAFFRHMLAWPGHNNMLVRATKRVSPRAARQEFEHSFFMDNKGGRNLSRRFRLIITEKTFTR